MPNVLREKQTNKILFAVCQACALQQFSGDIFTAGLDRKMGAGYERGKITMFVTNYRREQLEQHIFIVLISSFSLQRSFVSTNLGTRHY